MLASLTHVKASAEHKNDRKAVCPQPHSLVFWLVHIPHAELIFAKSAILTNSRQNKWSVDRLDKYC